MIQAELVQKLDAFFDVQAFNERNFWSGILSPSDQAVYRSLAESEFFEGTWNGLMLNSTPEVDRVYLIVFPNQEVLDTVLALELERSAPGALIFAHHPADFEESGRGFVGISEVQLETLREQRISYYNCHAPLDCHQEISTVIALARALKLHDWELFSPHHGGMEGVLGKVRDMSFGAFAEMLAEVTELPHIRYNQIRFNTRPVQRIALIPGGGDHPRHLEQARDLGCDTYVTGTWWPVGEYEYADRQREVMGQIVPTMPMNLIGTSHYASEMVVMRDQMPGWFRNAGIEARFIRQPDPWR